MGNGTTLATAVGALLEGTMASAEFKDHLEAFALAMRGIQEQFDSDVGVAASKMPSDQRLLGKIQRFRTIFDTVDTNLVKMRRYFQDGNLDHVRVSFERINQAADEFAELSKELQGITG